MNFPEFGKIFLIFLMNFPHLGSTFLILTEKGAGTGFQGSHFFWLCLVALSGEFESGTKWASSGWTLVAGVGQIWSSPKSSSCIQPDNLPLPWLLSFRCSASTTHIKKQFHRTHTMIFNQVMPGGFNTGSKSLLHDQSNSGQLTN